MDSWWVYIVEKREKLDVGVTTGLPNRMLQHGATAPLYQEGPSGKKKVDLPHQTFKNL